MSFAVMRVARRADPHPDDVHNLLDERARICGRVDRQQRAHQLHQVRARERGLVDARHQALQPRAVAQRGAGTTTGAPKSERSRRTLPMPTDVMAALRTLNAQQKRERLALGAAWIDTGLIAINEDGSPIRRETYSTAFRRHCAAAGVSVIRLHDTRHTAATRMQVRGIAFDASFGVVGDRDPLRDFGFGAAAGPVWRYGRHAI